MDWDIYVQLQPHELLGGGGAARSDSILAKSAALLDDVAAWLCAMVITVHVDGKRIAIQMPVCSGIFY